jgi:hypothetical protein
MARSRSRTLLGIPLTGALLGVAFLAPGSSTLEGCATQETTPAPDAAPAPCKTGPVVHCQPVGPEAPGCSSDDVVNPLLAQLPRGTRYPAECVVYFVGNRDENGDCRNEVVCKCLITDAPPASAGDGGLEAGPAPIDPAPAAPAWNCG